MMAFVACAALTIVSCSNDEVADSAVKQKEQAIEFGTYVGRDVQSRGAVATDVDVKNKSFGVFAYYTGNKGYDDAVGSSETVGSTTAANFMYNQKVTWNTSAWEYSPVKYWPNNGYYSTGTNPDQYTDLITFMAYSPYDDGSGSTGITGFKTNASAGPATFTFKVKDAVAEQVDLLAATMLKDQKKQATGGKLLFDFQHVLSRVGFQVATVTDATGNTPSPVAANTKIKVKKVELLGKFDNEATLQLSDHAWSDIVAPGSDVIYVWNEPNMVGGVAIELNNTTYGLTPVNNTDSYAMLIPQTLSEGVKIRVTYDVITEDNALNGGQSLITNEVISSATSSFTFEEGKAYTFNLYLGMTSVKVDAQVAEWPTATTQTIDVPTNY